MSPEQRAANVAKQLRFQRQHPGYKYRHDPLRWNRRSMDGRRPNYRTFELADPRRPGLVRLIGYTQESVKPVWDRLWSVRELSQSRWAAWLRELDEQGLRPVEWTWLTLGTVIPIGRAVAHKIVQLRLQSINQQETGDPFTCPDSIVRNLEALDSRSTVLTPVGCLFPDGTVGRYPSVSAAARENKIGCQVQLRHHIWTVGHDTQGRLWWDD